MREAPVSFFRKVDADYAAYLLQWQDKPFTDVVAKVSEINHAVLLYRGLHTSGFPLQPECVDYLNRFAHPLYILLAHWEEYCGDEVQGVLGHLLRCVHEDRYADQKGFPLAAETPHKIWYPVLCGALSTMESYVRHGVPGLNPKTMRWELIDRDALYTVRIDKKIEDSSAEGGTAVLGTLLCDRNLKAIAQQKGLIF